MQTYSTSICVSESATKKYLIDNFDKLLDEVGPHLFEGIGMVIHKIFHHATTAIKYKDIFDDVECDAHDTHHTDL
jgi:hypothetical protein